MTRERSPEPAIPSPADSLTDKVTDDAFASCLAVVEWRRIEPTDQERLDVLGKGTGDVVTT